MYFKFKPICIQYKISTNFLKIETFVDNIVQLFKTCILCLVTFFGI